MEMHQVRYFLAVCEALNFTRAAEACHVAQPSLTAAIKKLEQELGGELFRRERSRTHLTDLGKLMRPHMEQVSAASEAAKADAYGFTALEKAEIQLGVMSTIGPTQIVGFLTRLNQDIPAIELSIREAAGKDLTTLLLEGEIDVGLIGLPSFSDRLNAIPLYSERYTIAFAQGHAFEQMNTVPLSRLDGEDYLVRLHCEFTDHFEAMGFEASHEVKVRYSSEREDWIQAMVLAGMGCTVMPEFLPLLPGIATRSLVEPEIARTISLVTVAGRRHSPAVGALVRLAQRYPWPR
jgi:DNA-binding transcriptional LysR family regulator